MPISGSVNKMKKHLFVVAGLIFEDGKLFSTKRGDSKYSYVAHKYEFPGGKVEAGETEEQALKRELKEELEMDVDVGGLYAKLTYEYPDFIITLSVYECVRKSSYVLNVHESCAFLAPKDLDKDEWAPADADVIDSIKRIFG